MLVRLSRLASKVNLFLTLPSASTPKTAERMILAEFLWKLSKLTAATAPRTRAATALQASPTKSGTWKICAPSFSFLTHEKYQLYESFSERRAWSAVSTVMISVIKSGPSWRARALMT
eukprot:Mycagemm_TRINITY_DN10274_c0_g1::TRINITY_DN10274_c0_g1_i1::g.4160::m.4160 type:complete len:118 gc:universal TRINITY_DN10274_c0_g1_i1:752-1105(+)